jgi:membrane protein DedA with SNARE-associated domain
MQALVQHYGYLAILVGTFLEGETMLMLGSYAAHRGYLQLPGVIFAGFIAAMISDQLWFYLGRRHGARLLARYTRVAGKVQSLLLRVDRHGAPLVLATRFLWGLRIALPVAVGMSRMPYLKFLALTAISAAAWSCGVTLLGFEASRLLATWAAALHRQERLIFTALAVLAILIIAWRWRPARTQGADGAG